MGRTEPTNVQKNASAVDMQVNTIDSCPSTVHIISSKVFAQDLCI